jgi:hypothetical protein
VLDARGRLNDDGSLDVWVGGWRATFPPGGEEPGCEAGAAPEDAGPAPAGVRTGQRAGKTVVRYGDWIVTFGPGDPEVRPAKPAPDAGGSRYFDYESPDA